MTTTLLVLSALSVGRAARATSGQVNSLVPWRWQSRLLLVFAASDDAPDLLRQRDLVRPLSAGAAERDLVTIEVVADRASDPRLDGSALREAFGVPADQFAAILVGKDGGVKMRLGHPVSEADLFAAIDVMPMRRDEARRTP